MRTRIAIVVVVVVVLLLVARRASASGRPDPPSAAIGAFANAIARAEGYGSAGTIPTRANNPGDLVLGGPSIGAGITVFDTIEDGWNALYDQLAAIRDRRSGNFWPEMTIAQMGQTWAGASSWASNVAAALGVSTSTPIGSLL